MLPIFISLCAAVAAAGAVVSLQVHRRRRAGRADVVLQEAVRRARRTPALRNVRILHTSSEVTDATRHPAFGGARLPTRAQPRARRTLSKEPQ